MKTFCGLFLLAVIPVLASCGRHGPGTFQERLSMSGVAGAEVSNPSLQQDPSFYDFENQNESSIDKQAAQSVHAGFVFQSPVDEPFTISYFYGPRILKSLAVSLALENGTRKAPASVVADGTDVVAYLTKYWQFHTGVDFSVKDGTPVKAVGDGEVFASGVLTCPGRVLVIKHILPQNGQVIYALYEHLQSVKAGLNTGDTVKAGDELGLSGHSGTPVSYSKGVKTGCVQGDNLHFELRTPTQRPESGLSENIEARWNYIYNATAKLNPADFIEGIENKCEVRRKIEIANGQALEQTDPGGVPPLTAGRCSQKFESQIRQFPKIFQFQNLGQVDVNDLKDKKASE